MRPSRCSIAAFLRLLVALLAVGGLPSFTASTHQEGRTGEAPRRDGQRGVSASSAAAGEQRPSWRRHMQQGQPGVAFNISRDDPQQRLALQQLYQATGGPSWVISQQTGAAVGRFTPWLTPNTSYCTCVGASSSRSRV